MAKALIVYSSQNGSTGAVAERIAKALRGEGHRIDIIKLRPSLRVEAEHYDFIGLGCPVYMFRPSFEMTDFLDGVDNLAGKPVFTFTTYGSEIGDGANRLRDKPKGRGARDMGSFSCSGRHLFPGYTKRGVIFSPEGPTAAELEAAGSFARTLSEGLKSNGRSEANARDGATHWVSRFERLVTNRVLVRHLYSRFFRRDARLCASCGKCARDCPARNIAKGSDGSLVWGRDCIFCLKCEISCPKRAISSPIAWPIFAPFLAYNVKRAITKGLPYDRGSKDI